VKHPEKTYDWQLPYTAAICETDNLLMEGRIGEALSAVEERRLSPVQVGSDEGHALAEADAGIQSLITERTEKAVRNSQNSEVSRTAQTKSDPTTGIELAVASKPSTVAMSH
jgi:histidine ammonia-lyase